MKSLLKSRKFWIAILGSSIPVANRVFGLEMVVEEVIAAVSPLVALIFGIAWEDAAKGERDDDQQ